jgi:chromosome segregation ATPase
MSCQIKIDDYETKRNENIKNINKYYQDLLSGYTTNSRTLKISNGSGSVNDRQFAATQLAPKVNAYSDQLYNVSNELSKQVKDNTGLIQKQKEELDYIKSKSYDVRKDIQHIKTEMKKYNNEIDSHNQNMNEIKENINDNQFYITGIRVLCGLLLVIIILGIAFLVMYIGVQHGNNGNNTNSGVRNTRLNNLMKLKV